MTHHLPPVAAPSHRAGDGKQHREHAHRDAQRPQHNAREKVHLQGAAPRPFVQAADITRAGLQLGRRRHACMHACMHALWQGCSTLRRRCRAAAAYVWVEAPLDKVLVLRGNLLQLHCHLQKRILPADDQCALVMAALAGGHAGCTSTCAIRVALQGGHKQRKELCRCSSCRARCSLDVKLLEQLVTDALHDLCARVECLVDPAASCTQVR
jgi:hypothetical protein